MSGLMRRTLIGLALAVICIHGGVRAAHCQSSTVRGVVVDTARGSPVARASVSLVVRPAVTTDADGTFRFTAVPRGRSVLTVTAIGYTAAEINVVVLADTVT